MNTVQEIKQRYSIIGSSPLLDHAIRTAMQVAPTEITVLVLGESGVGKEVFPQIIHQMSARKHGPYIAVNCGAIPEGTIDSELFGHEKGSFTGAHDARKGYFEVVNGGTIFLDEVADLPLPTQARLLRVLETGEFIRVGSSKVQKTDVRVVAATNVNVMDAVASGKFREDLFYRLSTVPIHVPALRQRKEDIVLLVRKFGVDFADKYRMPAVELDADAQRMITEYRWPGNVRQLKNLTEQISILEKNKKINSSVLLRYLPSENTSTLPVLFNREAGKAGEFTDRELLYKVLFDMKKDLTELKKVVYGIIENAELPAAGQEQHVIKELFTDLHEPVKRSVAMTTSKPAEVDEHEEVEETLSLQQQEEELIRKALEKYKGKRKYAARELGISERTLYRKIKEYKI